MGGTLPPPSLLTPGSPKDACLVHCFTPFFTHDCCAVFPSNHIVKFVDDTTCLGSLTTTMRQHIGMRYNTWPYGVITIPWFLTSRSWKEIIVDFHKTGQYKQSPLSIDKEVVERVTDCKFFGVIVSDDLSWSTNTADVIGKAQQRLYYLRKLKSAKIPRQLMVNFYNFAISSVLSYGFLVWFSSCTEAGQQALQRVVRTAGKIIGTTLPEMSSTFTTRCLRHVKNILRDQHHPAHHLFHLLPSGRRYRSIRARTARLAHSIYPEAARLLNRQSPPILPISIGTHYIPPQK